MFLVAKASMAAEREEGVPMSREAVLERLDGVIQRLNRGPTAEDVTHGWNPQICQIVAAIMKTLRRKVEEGTPVAGELRRRLLARDLDIHGISDGDLFDDVIAVVYELRQW